jgi:hypothetical protein
MPRRVIVPKRSFSSRRSPRSSLTRTHARPPGAHRAPHNAPTASPSSPSLRVHSRHGEESSTQRVWSACSPHSSRCRGAPASGFPRPARAEALPTISPRPCQHPIYIARGGQPARLRSSAPPSSCGTASSARSTSSLPSVERPILSRSPDDRSGARASGIARRFNPAASQHETGESGATVRVQGDAGSCWRGVGRGDTRRRIHPLTCAARTPLLDGHRSRAEA